MPTYDHTTDSRVQSAPDRYRSMIDHDRPRFAVVLARTVREAEAYLPSNYALMESYPTDDHKRVVVIIGGHDHAGWTLDGYVIPRYLSGLIGCAEITDDHERM